MFYKKPASNKALVALIAALTLSQLAFTDTACALSLPVSNKRPNLHLPASEQLDEEAMAEEESADGSSTTSSAAKSSDSNQNTDSAKKPEALAPLRLKDNTTEEEADGSTVMKTGASVNDFAPKGPDGDNSTKDLPAINIKGDATGKDGKGKLGQKVLSKNATQMEKAESTNLMPLALTESEKEVQEKGEYLENSEKKQIADLWEATLEKSPDIQFVIQKMMPTSDKAHATHVMMKMMSTVLMGGVGAIGFMSPTPTQGTYMMQNMGYSLLSQLNGTMDKKTLQKAALGQAEIIALYNMVRQTADRMVDQYRCYKKNKTLMVRATNDLEELKAMASAAQKTPPQQLEMDYTIRKAQRDVDSVVDDVHRFRQNLMDIAGVEAVAKLDTQLQEEAIKLDDTKLDTTPVSQLATPKDQSANGGNM